MCEIIELTRMNAPLDRVGESEVSGHPRGSTERDHLGIPRATRAVEGYYDLRFFALHEIKVGDESLTAYKTYSN